MCRIVAGLTDSPDQWNAYSSTIIERLQGFQPGTAGRYDTDYNSFDPAEMKHERTALFIVGSARSDTSRAFVGAMGAAIIARFADAHGPLRALVVGEEWGQLYVSNFMEILTLYRQGGIDFLGVFQNAPAPDRNPLWKGDGAHLEESCRAHDLSGVAGYRDAEGHRAPLRQNLGDGARVQYLERGSKRLRR